MREKKDFSGLILSLTYPEHDIQWKAAEALGDLGREDKEPLLKAIRKKNKSIRLGIIEALARIKDPDTVPVLVDTLQDKSPEVRWEAALALGEIGASEAIPPLVQALTDGDRYVRYGASQSLQALEWSPGDESEQAYYFLGKQDWDVLSNLGEAAIDPLTLGLHDRDVGIRAKAAETLGRIGSQKGSPALYKALSDDDEMVRWQAVKAARKCGMPLVKLPRGLSKRKRKGQSPWVAAFLNAAIPGIGYLYIGKWWGILLFQIELYATTLFLSYAGTLDTWLIDFYIFLPLWVFFAAHAWYLASKIPDL